MKSNEIDKLASALAKAQGKMSTAQKDGRNPHFGSSYATLASIWDACRMALSENGLSISQIISQGTDGLILETLLLHSSGQWLQSEILIPANSERKGVNEVQSLGSTLTYLKRYALAAMVGVVADDDDDGNASDATTQPKKQTVKPTPTNGKSHRPMTPEQIKAKTTTGRFSNPKPGSDDQLDYAASSLSKACGGDDKKRRSIVAYLFEKQSMSDLNSGQLSLIIEWIGAKAENNYQPSEYVAAEIEGIIREYQRQQGQLDMALDIPAPAPIDAVKAGL